MNPILHLSKKHYIKKITQGKATKEYVASLYSTTVENIESAINEYDEQKKPFKKIDIEARQGRINIFVSLVSTILVLFTLFEMQAERDAAYKPNIHINSAGIEFAWDQSHNILFNTNETDEEMQSVLDAFDYSRGLNVNLDIQNTGVGTATDVAIDWLYEENISSFQQMLSNYENEIVSLKDRIISIQVQGTTIGQPISRNKELLHGFLCADSSQQIETISIPFPYIYLYELAYAHFMQDFIPHVKFVLEYKDIQGKPYNKEFTIVPSVEYITMHPDGHGAGSVRLDIMEKHYSASWVWGTVAAIIGFIVIAYVLVDWLLQKKKAYKKISEQNATKA